MSDTFALFLAQVPAPAPATTTTSFVPATPSAPAADPNAGGGSFFFMLPVLFGLFYFAFIRPQSQAKKKQEDLVKSAKTGDRVVTTSGIHGVITNVKDSTVIVKVADNVKLEIEKTHVDKVIRPDSAESDKTVATKS
jgi:preprotein translocase subunit YajC